MSAASEATETTAHPGSAFEVLRVFTRLGLTSFGGPIAHLGFFRTEFVERRQWLDEAHYADVVALSQFFAGTGKQQGRHYRRRTAGRDAGSTRRLGWVHNVVRARAGPVRLRRRRLRPGRTVNSA